MTTGTANLKIPDIIKMNNFWIRRNFLWQTIQLKIGQCIVNEAENGKGYQVFCWCNKSHPDCMLRQM